MVKRKNAELKNAIVRIKHNSNPYFFSKKSFRKLTILCRLPKKVSTSIQFFYNLLNKLLHKKNCTKLETFLSRRHKIVNFLKLFFKKIRIWKKCRKSGSLPLLTPFVSRRTVHSSMVPNELNITRTSLSLNFLETMPTNNFRSVKKIVQPIRTPRQLTKFFKVESKV